MTVGVQLSFRLAVAALVKFLASFPQLRQHIPIVLVAAPIVAVFIMLYVMYAITSRYQTVGHLMFGLQVVD
jgi:hypothetical protein